MARWSIVQASEYAPCPSGTCPATGKLHVLGRPLLATGVWRRERLCGTLSFEKTETPNLEPQFALQL